MPRGISGLGGLAVGCGLLRNSGAKRSYNQKLQDIWGAADTGCWPMTETTGYTAKDSISGRSGPYRNTAGVPVGVALANGAGAVAGTMAPYFDGTGSFLDLYSPELQAAWNGAAGTLIALAKLPAAVWTDSTQRQVIYFGADSSNKAQIFRTAANNTLRFGYYAGGTGKNVVVGSLSYTDWILAAISWDKAADQVIASINGVQVGTTQTGLGTWVGTLSTTNMCVGAASTGSQDPWKGWIQYATILNRAATLPELLKAYQSI